MMNIINGGVHADNPIDIQEFMIMPVGAATFAEAVRMGAEIFHTLKKALQDAGPITNVGDEGGFAPNLKSADEALDFIMKAIEAAGYKPGEDVMLALDCAATEFFKDGKYAAGGRGQDRSTPPAWSNISPTSSRAIPIISIEDGMAEDDWDGWKALTETHRRQAASSSATISSSPTPSAWRRASSGASPTRSWSRSTRSARCPRRSTPSTWRSAPATPP